MALSTSAAIRASLTPPTPDEVNTGIRDKRWFVDGDEAFAFYLLDTSTLPPSPAHTTTTHIVERFKIAGGLIKEIEAIREVAIRRRDVGSIARDPAAQHECIGQDER